MNRSVDVSSKLTSGGAHVSCLALSALLLCGGVRTVLAQGCIASRGSGVTFCQQGGQRVGDASMPPSVGFQAAVSYRWLHSDRMFSGDVEQTQREADGSQDINDSHFIDVGITYAFTPRWSATLTVPFSVQDRSQVVRALNGPRTILARFHTQASGLGDVRLEGNGWLLDPTEHPRGNVLFGLGIAAPTGDRDTQDVFLVPSLPKPRPQLHAVDQSIQPGNGGWGVVLDFFAYRQLAPRWLGFVNGNYTLTPEEKYTPTASLSGDYSIADSYLARGGFEFVLAPQYGVTLNLAGRIDGVPVRDVIGGSTGFRRPGYAVSLEPGISWMNKSWSVSVNTPVALYRNRLASLDDLAADQPPAAAGFADFLITASISKRF